MIANVFGRAQNSQTIEEALGGAMLKVEQKSGHKSRLPTLFETNHQEVKAEDRVLEFISQNAGCTRAEIASATKMHANTVSNVLTQSLKENRVRSQRDKKIGKGIFARYWISNGKERA